MVRVFEWLSVPLLVVPVTANVLWLLVDASGTSRLWFIVFLVNVVFSPLISIIWLERRRFVSDLDLRNKRERLAFLGLMVLVSVVNAFDAWVLSAPRVIQVLDLLVLSLVLSMGAISAFWKISIHLLVLTAVITVAYLVKGPQSLAWLPLLPLVAFHRVYFRHHTLGQVLAGASLGFIVSFLVVKLVGLS